MAYGHVPAPKKEKPLAARLYSLPSKAITKERASIVAWPIECSSGQVVPSSLAKRLRQVFNDELEKGVTYPQRGPMSEEEFSNYFLSYDLIIGVLLSQQQTANLTSSKNSSNNGDIPKTGLQVDPSQGFFDDSDWDKVYGYSYYIKVSLSLKLYELYIKVDLFSKFSQIIQEGLHTSAMVALLCHLPIEAWDWEELQPSPFSTMHPCVVTREACLILFMPITKLLFGYGSD